MLLKQCDNGGSSNFMDCVTFTRSRAPRHLYPRNAAEYGKFHATSEPHIQKSNRFSRNRFPPFPSEALIQVIQSTSVLIPLGYRHSHPLITHFANLAAARSAIVAAFASAAAFFAAARLCAPPRIAVNSSLPKISSPVRRHWLA